MGEWRCLELCSLAGSHNLRHTACVCASVSVTDCQYLFSLHTSTAVYFSFFYPLCSFPLYAPSLFLSPLSLSPPPSLSLLPSFFFHSFLSHSVGEYDHCLENILCLEFACLYTLRFGVQTILPPLHPPRSLPLACSLVRYRYLPLSLSIPPSLSLFPTLSLSFSLPLSLSLCESLSPFLSPPCLSSFHTSLYPPLAPPHSSSSPLCLPPSPQVTIPSPPTPSFAATLLFPPTDLSSYARSCWVWTRTSRWVMGGGRGRVIESHGGCGRGRAGG